MNQIELIEKRKLREKRYLQRDGTIRAEIYDTDVHFLRNGKYEEIDNTLVHKNDRFINKCNSYKVEFKDDYNNSLMKVSRDNYYLDFKLDNIIENRLKNTKRVVSKNLCNMLCTDVTDDISINHQVLSDKVKETIILHNSNHLELSFLLDTNLLLEEKDGEILALDKNYSVIFKMEKPYMIDSNKIRNENIHYIVKRIDNSYALELLLDKDWLFSEDRLFPVLIDPTITIDSNNNSSFEDTFIYSGDSNDNNYTLDYLIAGTTRNNNVDRINRTLIRFPLPEIGTSDEIVDAYLSLFPYVGENTSESYDNFVEVHRITHDWHESTAKWNNMYDKFDSRVEELMPTYRSTIELNSIEGYPIYFNLTGLVKKWYQDTPNYGVMLKSSNESYLNNSYPMFFSSDTTVTGNPKPVFVLQYKNRNGIEDYWDYKKQVYSSGSSFVNTHTGNLTTIFKIGHTIGGTFPANLDLVYNTNDVVLNNQTFFGKGYKLSLEQEIIVHNDQLEYFDEDGTSHFFTKIDENSNIYNDEDGLRLTIELINNKYVMKDEYNTKKEYESINNHYLLKKVSDADNNEINIIYNSNNSIQKVVDSFSNEITITYNANNVIITSSDNTYVELNYNNNQLVNMETIDGFIYFVYDNNGIITSIEDVTGIKYFFQYYDNEPYKIKKIIQYGLNNVLGKSYEFNYSVYETSIVNNNGIIENISYDNNGNVCSRSILNEENGLDDAYSIEKEYGTNNNLTSSMIMNKYVKNYLNNSSFESNSMIFTADSGITQSFDMNYYNNGTRSLKVVSTGIEKSLTKIITVPKGDYYTFSGYFLGTILAEISLSYIDSNNHEVKSSQFIDMNNNAFTRNDVTLLYEENATSDLSVCITIYEIGTIYVDDIQLEKNPVVNYYNLIENSDFDNGLNGWNCTASRNNISVNPSDYISIVGVNNKNALHIDMEPKLLTRVERNFDIKGTEGDSYSISFWYKNHATTQYAQYVGSSIIIFYEPYDDENGHCIISQSLPITNGNSWQHFIYTEKAIEDFKSIKIIFQNYGSSNDFEVTNISFYKDIPRNRYLYSDNGRLNTIVNQNDEEKSIDYDSNEQIVKSTDTLGNSVLYEYDATKKNRLINSITSSGLSDFNYYDTNGNLVKKKKSKRYINSISSEQYKIRLQGTIKYVKAEMNLVLLEKSDCSNTIWYLEKINDKYKIKNALNTAYSISYNDDIISLTDCDSNNLFMLEKNSDGSYSFIYEKSTNDGIELMVLYASSSNELLSKPYSSTDKDNTNYYIELFDSLFMEIDKEYTNDGKFLSAEIDSCMNKNNYEYYNQSGLLKKIINSNGTVTEYSYNNKNQCSRIKYDNIFVDYSYNNKLLSNIYSGNKNYSISYDNFENVSSVCLNNNLLSSMEYYSNNGKMKKITFGNGQYVSSDYDSFDRLSKLVKSDDIYNYYYDTNSNLSKIVSDSDIRKIYYDTNNRPYRYSSTDFIVDYSYNSEGCILQKNLRYKDNYHTQNNTFDNEKLISTNLDNDVQITYSYDDLNRNISKNVGNTLYTSLTFDKLGKRTSSLLGKYTVNGDEYSIVYDDSLNVKQVYLNNVLIQEYEYDNYNELLCEIDYDTNIEIDYVYDTSGNILSRTSKDMSNNIILSTDIFTYLNNSWEDQLSSYNNNSITYDNIGNMIAYKNNTYTWKNGNELSTTVNSNNNLNVSYKYDDKGIRISKIINGMETKYINLNDDIIYEDRNGTIIYYLYDSDGIIGFNYNNNYYYYIKNPHNDIIGILDENGIIVAYYRYDSWGKLLSIKDGNNNDVTNNTNHIGNINPFRYKSYYYDVETGLYYLRHRYYNPEIMRFISPDAVIGANKDILSYNLYSYVGNNPISNCDYTGYGIISSVIVFSIKKIVSKVIKSAKKMIKSTISNYNVYGVFKEDKKELPGFAISYGYGSNIKKSTYNSLSNFSTIVNTSGYSTDYNFKNCGYDVGYKSFDFYASNSLGDVTAKNTFGIDEDYLFFGYDSEMDIDSYESISAYVRINVKTDIIKKLLFVTYGTLAIVAGFSVIPSIGTGVASVAVPAATSYLFISRISSFVN